MQSRFSFAVLPLVLTHSGAHETPFFCWNGTIHIAVIFHPVSLCLQQWGRGGFFFCFTAYGSSSFLLLLFFPFYSLFSFFLKVFVWMSSFGTPSIAGFSWSISEVVFFVLFFLRWWIISDSWVKKWPFVSYNAVLLVVTLQLCVATLFFYSSYSQHLTKNVLRLFTQDPFPLPFSLSLSVPLFCVVCALS